VVPDGDAEPVEQRVVEGPHRSQPGQEGEDRPHSPEGVDGVGQEVDDLDHGEREQGDDGEVVHGNLRVVRGSDN
jgi:hypothetical protein